MSQMWNGPSNWVLVVADESVYLPQAPIRLLWEAGARVVLMAPPGQPMRWSRYVSRRESLAIDTATAAEQIAAFYARHQDELALVVHCREDVAQLLAEQGDHPSQLTCIPQETAAACSSKTQFRRWAQGRIDLPQGSVFRDIASAQAWVHHHGKSMLKVDGAQGGTGVRMVSTAADVLAAWNGLLRPAEFIVEEFLPGVSGVTELVLDHGRVLASCSSFKAVTTHGPFGPSCARHIARMPEMAGLVEQVASATGYRGLCGFDWIWNERTRSLHLIEFHPRTPSGFGVAAHAGVDVVQALRTLLGTSDPAELTSQQGRAVRPSLPLPAVNSQRVFDGVYCYFPLHMAYILRTRDGQQLRCWLPGSNAVSWANVPWDDPGQLAAIALKGARTFYHSLRHPTRQPALTPSQPDVASSHAGQSRAA